MASKFMTLSNKLHVLHLELAFSKHKNDIEKIYEELISSGLDNNTLGFWIWDIPNHVEIYSPKFRESLGFKNERDFPNSPDSWMDQIMPKDKDKAFANFEKHVSTGGEYQYEQTVTYRKKVRGEVELICMGKVVSWENDKPKLMIGVHKEVIS